MKSLRKVICLIFLIPFIFSFNGISQNIKKDSSDIKLINVAMEIMTAAETCALITLDEEGRPRVRVMDPFIPENDLTVWLGTNPKSRKVHQIKKDPRVTLYYLDSNASGYVMIHGIAQIIDDQIEKKERWKDEWESFYPNKPEGYLLIKVSPEWMEVISYKHGVLGSPTTWQPPKVFFKSKN
jgi:general stress protein 26